MDAEDYQEDHMDHSGKLSFLKTKLLYINDHLETLKLNELFLSSICAKPDTNQFTKDRYSQIKAKIENYTKLSNDLTKEIKDIESNKIANEVKLPLPKFGSVDDANINVKNLKLSTITFDGTNGLLEEWWKKLFSYGLAKDFSENAFKFAIGITTSNEPFDIYYAKQNESLQTILDVFVDKYGPILTLQDYLEKLESFQRLPNETISSAMVRLNILIDKTQSSVSPNERELRKILLKDQYIMKLAYPKAQKKVRCAKADAHKYGFSLTFDNVLEIVKDAEKNESSAVSLSAIDVDRSHYREDFNYCEDVISSESDDENELITQTNSLQINNFNTSS